MTVPAPREPRLTQQSLLVLGLLLNSTTLCGAELIGLTGIRSGTLYPILHRLEKAGWLMGEWERIAIAGRPLRLFYRLTHKGRAKAENALRPIQSL